MIELFFAPREKKTSVRMRIDEVREMYERGEIVDDEAQQQCLYRMLKMPDLDIADNVEFLITRTVCPVDSAELLVAVVSQPSFHGQLKVARMLLAAGAPHKKAEEIANAIFDQLWGLISGSAQA